LPVARLRAFQDSEDVWQHEICALAVSRTGSQQHGHAPRDFDDDDAEIPQPSALLRELSQLARLGCAACSRSICWHEALFKVVLGRSGASGRHGGEQRNVPVRRALIKAKVVATMLALFYAAFALIWDVHGFAEPPRVGERIDPVINRLGPPHFDSREAGDPAMDYQLGYTDGLGTRHHLRVQDGVITEIRYSSR